MIELIFKILFSFFITLFLLPIIIQLAAKHNYFVPRQFRKVHTGNISALGGIAIFSGVFFTILFFGNFSETVFSRYYLAAGLFIFLFGLRDDFKNVKPFGKIIGQIIASLIVIIPGGIKIHQIILFNHQLILPFWVSMLVSVFIFIWFINAYNFFDGIDMQAALTATAFLLPAGFWFYYTNQLNFSLLLLSTSSALVAFMYYNYTPSKIFMGDTGTVTIGFIIAFGFIKFTNLNTEVDFQDLNIRNPFLFGILSFQLPLFDSIRVVIKRIFNGKNPTKADRTHFHHLLLKVGWSHNKIAFFSGFYTAALIFINYFLFKYGLNTNLILAFNLFGLSAVYYYIFKLISMKQKATHLY